jgi:hypothetical protein
VDTGINCMEATLGTYAALERFKSDKLIVSMRLYWNQIETSAGVYIGSKSNPYYDTIELCQSLGFGCECYFLEPVHRGQRSAYLLSES